MGEWRSNRRGDAAGLCDDGVRCGGDEGDALQSKLGWKMFALGVIAALAAPMVMTFGFFIWEGIWKGSAFLLNTFKCTLASAVFIVVVGCLNAAEGVAFFSHSATSRDVGMLILSSMLGIVIGDTCWLSAMKMLGARRVIMIDALKPFLAAIVGFVGLGEPLTWSLVLGLCLTMSGVLVVNLEKENLRERSASMSTSSTQSKGTTEENREEGAPKEIVPGKEKNAKRPPGYCGPSSIGLESDELSDLN